MSRGQRARSPESRFEELASVSQGTQVGVGGGHVLKTAEPYIDVLPIRLRDPHATRHYQSKHNLSGG